MQSKAYWALFLTQYISPNHKETLKLGDDFFLTGGRWGLNPLEPTTVSDPQEIRL